jgi:hypothetical protein
MKLKTCLKLCVVLLICGFVNNGFAGNITIRIDSTSDWGVINVLQGCGQFGPTDFSNNDSIQKNTDTQIVFADLNKRHSVITATFSPSTNLLHFQVASGLANTLTISVGNISCGNVAGQHSCDVFIDLTQTNQILAPIQRPF